MDQQRFETRGQERQLPPYIDLMWAARTKHLSQYPMVVQDVHPIDDKRALIKTENRALQARIIPLSTARLRRAVLDFVAGHRFRNTQRFIRTLYGDPYVPIDNSDVLYLTDACLGQPLEPTLQNYLAAADNLNHLHRALNGFIESHQWVRTESATPSTSEWMHRISRANEGLAHPAIEDDWANQFWKLWGDRLVEYAASVTNVLQRSAFNDVPTARPSVAWNDYTLSILVRTEGSRSVTTLVEDGPVLDNSLLDFATLVADAVSHLRSDEMVRVLQAYQPQPALSDAEWASAIAFAVYPHALVARLHPNRSIPWNAHDYEWCTRQLEALWMTGKTLLDIQVDELRRT